MSALHQALWHLGRGEDLSVHDAEAAVAEVLSGGVADAAVAAFLTALRFKGETSEELTGAVLAVRARMQSLAGVFPPLLDTCGTGGDCANTINVSTAAAIVVAACGAPVAKHGNRSASGNSGSAEVLTELGIAIEADAAMTTRCLNELGIAFLFAPRFHPALRNLAVIRRQLPFRTLFNLVGPLANPARPSYQLIGAAGERAADLVAHSLLALGVERAAVVAGDGGLDEVTLSGPTSVRWIEHKRLNRLTWVSDDFELPAHSVDDLKVSGPRESADRLIALVDGRLGPDRDIVLANAASALLVRGAVDSLLEGVTLAASALDRGAARDLVDRWRSISPAEA
jgi:anthranilate phosphoribosyltransferase